MLTSRVVRLNIPSMIGRTLGHYRILEKRGNAESGYRGAMRLAGDQLAARAKLTYVQPTHIAGFYAYPGRTSKLSNGRKGPTNFAVAGWFF